VVPVLLLRVAPSPLLRRYADDSLVENSVRVRPSSGTTPPAHEETWPAFSVRPHSVTESLPLTVPIPPSRPRATCPLCNRVAVFSKKSVDFLQKLSIFGFFVWGFFFCGGLLASSNSLWSEFLQSPKSNNDLLLFENSCFFFTPFRLPGFPVVHATVFDQSSYVSPILLHPFLSFPFSCFLFRISSSSLYQSKVLPMFHKTLT